MFWQLFDIHFPASQTPASLLQQISLREGQTEDSTPVQLITSVQLTPGPGDQSNKTKNLIQVISSSVTAQPPRPQHQLTVNSDPRDLSRSLELTVELPKVQSITECHLSISQVRDQSASPSLVLWIRPCDGLTKILSLLLKRFLCWHNSLCYIISYPFCGLVGLIVCVCISL